MLKTIDIEEFLSLSKQTVIIDVRSEGEYLKGRFPGSVNLPILNDEHRKLVGTSYKKEGREQAVQLGFKLVGPLFSDLIEKAKQLAPDKKVALYCWRGGMRSNIMAWVLSMAGFKVTLLKGGYKVFRNFSISYFNSLPKLIVIGGKTGSGKTDFIKHCRENEIPAIDLEGLANHRGSAYGGIGLGPQPTQEQFENELGLEFYSNKNMDFCFIENESRLIGKIVLPNLIHDALREASVAQIEEQLDLRVKRIAKEYATMPVNELIENTRRIEKRLGNLQMRNAIEALENNDFTTWIKILLNYYDDNYNYSNSQRPKEKVFEFRDFENYEVLYERIKATFEL